MMSKEVLPPVGDGLKRRRRRRRPGTKRRALKTEVAAVAADVAGGTSKGRVPFKCAVHMFLLRYRTALRKVPAHLPPKIHAGPPSKRVKRVSWRDEECPGSGGGGDPAVLAMGPARKPLTYTRDELLQLRDSPLCKQALDAALRGSEALALVLKKRSDSPDNEDRGARGDAPNENHKGVYGRERDRERRSADPRERVRKESESQGSGIVLSPQRRSFTSGCGAPPPATRDSPPHHTQKPDPGPVRRIGSGRIMVRDVTAAPWEREEPEPAQPRESDRYRPPAQQPDRHPQRNIHDNRYERRSYGRDSYSSDMKRERDDRFNNEKGQHREDNRRQGSGRFTQRRFEKEDEPEWFSGGPTSQLETIELRGFDEPIKRNGTTNNNKEEKWNNNNNKDGGSRSPQPRRSTSSPPVSSANSDEMADCSNDKDSGVESKAGEEQATNNDNADFNLDDFLKFDTIPDVLTNGGGEAEGSRFSRWFRRDSPTQHDNRHYERLLHNMVDDLDAGSRAPPPPNTAIEQHVFAPISPALGASARPPSLLELLRRANVDERANELNNTSSVGGKIHSLEELEARLRPTQPPPQRSDHDQAAFKRLLAQVSGGHAVPAAEQRPPPPPPQPQPMSLLQMLNKSMEQQQKVQQQQHQQHQQHQQQQQPHIPQELVYKLLQVQQRQAQQPEITPPMHPNITEREMLQRPEALAIIQGLKAGEITVQNLMQQLGNPGMQSRHRELLITILRLHQQYRQQIGASPLPGVGPPANHLIVPPHHQPLRLSPVPHSGVPARIPSPRELQVHTQQIMHGALIKKKLEEQRENFRKRELQPKQQTAISFTPTSVLRKMTAEKESEAPSPKQQQWAPHKMPQGRPIVKGSQSGAAPPISMFAPSPADYQQHQHYLNQQQQMANAIRPFPHQQQRQLQPSQVSSLARGGTTLQQLLMQSHQRSLNEMGGEVMSGGGDNQLARWFSPELLARASAGKLPSLRVPNALSLEDLERNHHSPAVRN